MKTPPPFLPIIAALLALVPGNSAPAAPADLDGGFGVGGVARITDLPPSSVYHNSVSGMAVQPDGKILLSGTSDGKFLLLRRLPDGSPDLSFNGTGLLTTDFGKGYAAALDIAVDSGGRIIAAGGFNPWGGGNYVAVARYLPDGSPDTSFNRTGKVVLDLTVQETGRHLALQPDGKILVAGESNNGNILLRLTEDGRLDTTFAGTGIIYTRFGEPGYSGTCAAVAVQGDGGILLLGHRVRPANAAATALLLDVAVARYTPGGLPDTSFNGTGLAYASPGGEDYPMAMSVQKDGCILVVGWSADSTGQARSFVLRFKPDGKADASFGAAGRVINSVRGRLVGVTPQQDGKIVAVGDIPTVEQGVPSGATLLTRYQASGAPDPAFNGTGRVSTPENLVPGPDEGVRVKMQRDGRIVVLVNNANDPVLLCYEGGPPTPEIAVFDGPDTTGPERQSKLGAALFDSGSTAPGNVRTFTIENAGTQALSGLGATLSASGQPGDFEINSTDLAPTLAPGETTSFSVTFTPHADGPRNAELRISSNDSNENPFLIPLLGRAPALGFELPAQSVVEDLVPWRTWPSRGFAPRARARITVPVRLNAAAATAFNVKIGFGGTAKRGTDYVAGASVLHFAAGQTTASLILILTDDLAVEEDETIVLSLHSPSVDSVVLGASVIGTINILDDDDPPVITAHPAPPRPVVETGSSVTFEAAAAGSPPLAYQWRKNGVPIAGARSSTLTLLNVTLANAGAYTLQVTNGRASLVSTAAELSVVDTSPRTLPAALGAGVKFLATATGKDLAYQWRHGEALIPGATNKSFSLARTTSADAGEYFCNVTSGDQTLTIGPVLLALYDQAPEIWLAEGDLLSPAFVSNYYVNGVPFNTALERTPTTFSARGLPPGLVIAPRTGLISGRPTAGRAAPYRVTLTAANSRGSHSVNVWLSVTPLQSGLVGTWTGYVERAAMNYGLGGRYDMTVTGTGSLSGTLILGAKKLPFTGALQVDQQAPAVATATLSVPRPGLPPLTFAFTLDSTEASMLEGSLADDTTTVEIYGWRHARLGLVTPAKPLAGRYNQVWTPDPRREGDPSVPHGAGFACLKLTATGAVSSAGRLPDGTAYTWSSVLGDQGNIAIFQMLYPGGPGGSIVGQLIAQEDLVWGAVSWNRPPSANAAERVYADGFYMGHLSSDGTRYAAPVAPRVGLNLLPGVENAEMSFPLPLNSSSGADGTRLSIGARSLVTFPAGLPFTVTLKINAATGLFTGTYGRDDPDPLQPGRMLHRTAPFMGMIFSAHGSGQQSGAGCYLQPRLPEQPGETLDNTDILSGMVLLHPN